MCHWDYVLREGRWMAEDFMQVGGREVFTVQVWTMLVGGEGQRGREGSSCCVRVRTMTKGFMQAIEG